MIWKYALYFVFTVLLIGVPSVLVWRRFGDGWSAATMLITAAAALAVGVWVL